MQREYCQAHGKNAYDKRGAEEVRNAAWRDRHEALRVYCCPECRRWHVTKNVDRPKEKKPKRKMWR